MLSPSVGVETPGGVSVTIVVETPGAPGTLAAAGPGPTGGLTVVSIAMASTLAAVSTSAGVEAPGRLDVLSPSVGVETPAGLAVVSAGVDVETPGGSMRSR